MPDDGPDWKEVRGVVVRGHRVASGLNPATPHPLGTIRLQIPHFARRGLDLTGWHPATINVSIAPRRFTLRAPCYTFRNVAWTSLHPGEDFSFCRCRVVYGGEAVAGWVYTPHPDTKPDHVQPPDVLEIITRYLDGLTYGVPLILRLPPTEITVG